MPNRSISYLFQGARHWRNYHRADIRVRDGIKLLILELIVGADVDIGTPILGRVAVPGSREDLTQSV